MKEKFTSRLSERRVALALLLLITACSVAATLVLVTPRSWIDDAFIGLRYAKNMNDGVGLVFNAGERLEGYTGFLWILVQSLGLRFGFPPMAFLQVICVALQVLTLFVAYQLGRTTCRSPSRSLVAPLFLAFNYSFIAYPMTGMETTFFSILVPLAVLLYLRQFHKTLTGALVTGLVLLTICLTRFDGVVLVGIILSYKLFIDREIKDSLPIFAVLIVGVGAYNVWRWSYYPTILPNTFYAKMSTLSDQLMRGLHYMADYLSEGGVVVLLLALIPFALRRTSKATRFVTWVVSAHLLYVTVVGGDWMPGFRFLLPVLPLLFFLMQEGVWELYDLARSKLQLHRTTRFSFALLLSLLFILMTRPIYARGPLNQLSHGSTFRAEDARLIGIHLSERLPPDYVVAIEWAGIIPFYLRQPVLDIFGLNDLEIPQKFTGGGMGRAITVDYLVTRNPEIVIISARTFKTVKRAVRGANLKIRLTPDEHWYDKFYSALLSPESPYQVCVMKIDREVFWPVLVRDDLHDELELCHNQSALALVPHKTASD